MPAAVSPILSPWQIETFGDTEAVRLALLYFAAAGWPVNDREWMLDPEAKRGARVFAFLGGYAMAEGPLRMENETLRGSLDRLREMNTRLSQTLTETLARLAVQGQ